MELRRPDMRMGANGVFGAGALLTPIPRLHGFSARFGKF